MTLPEIVKNFSWDNAVSEMISAMAVNIKGLNPRFMDMHLDQ
jgi:hypothetical protein